MSLGQFANKFKKKIRKFNPRYCKKATLYCKKNYQNILSRIGFNENHLIFEFNILIIGIYQTRAYGHLKIGLIIKPVLEKIL